MKITTFTVSQSWTVAAVAVSRVQAENTVILSVATHLFTHGLSIENSPGNIYTSRNGK